MNKRASIDFKISFKEMVFKFIGILISTGILTFMIMNSSWDYDQVLIHTFLELICIFIGVSTFLLSWSTYSLKNSINHILGFGFLIISALDLLHVYYYERFTSYSNANDDITLKFWMMGRLAQGVILIIFAFYPIYSNRRKHKQNKRTKYKLLTLVILFILSVWYTATSYPQIYPTMYTADGMTMAKVIMEVVVITLAILAIIMLNKNYYVDERIRPKHILMSLMLTVPTGICFMIFKSTSSFWVAYGHVLKICSYYYLYKGIVESFIKYPYKKLEQSTSRLTDILDEIPISIATYDDDNNMDFVNKRFEEIIGWKREELVGLNPEEFLELVPKVEQEDEIPIVEKALYNSDGTERAIRTYITGFGEKTKLQVNAHKIENGVLVLFNDIKAEQQIMNLNLQTQIILEGMVTPAMILDNMNNVTACNCAFIRLVNMEKKDIIGISFNRLVDKVKVTRKLVSSKWDSNGLIEEVYESFFYHPQGNKIETVETNAIIYNIENEKIGSVCIIEDVTEEKEHQQKLINQEKLALLGQMSATIVHETRNFLTTIKGCSQLIEVLSKEEKVKCYAKKISENTDEVNKIISNLLTMSKPSQAVMEEVAISDLVASMESILETSTITKGIAVDFNINSDDRYVLCDEGQVKQVILNLCKNAVDAMSSIRDPILIIETKLDEEEKELWIKISDNGCGIPKENLSKIGTPFFTTKESGTGLGLNACFQIIKNHKGKIQVESEIGKGTTFNVRIPYIDYEEF
ncbi:MASE3 domain-containing protein [Clostridium sp.]|uniref:MASE3 domain-containing protein n=1 Tax=Clostridium sp. TaxID=1506 RepID=UPI002FCB341F